MSEEDWNAVTETLYLLSIPGMRESIREGESIAEPLRRSGYFPPMVTHMIAVGERSGQLEQMLQNVSRAYEADVETRVTTLTSLLEPMIIVVMGGMVAARDTLDRAERRRLYEEASRRLVDQAVDVWIYNSKAFRAVREVGVERGDPQRAGRLAQQGVERGAGGVAAHGGVDLARFSVTPRPAASTTSAASGRPPAPTTRSASAPWSAPVWRHWRCRHGGTTVWSTPAR